MAYLLIIAAIASGIATYAALTETPPLGNDPDTVIWLLNIDLIILLLLVALIARRIVSLWSGKKRGLAGSHLHVRLVYIFSILAAAPAIIMTIFSAFFFHFGVQTWFSTRVQTAIEESQAVAEAYLEEHRQVIRADTMAMATDLDREAPILMNNQEAFDKFVQTQSLLRNLSEVIVFEPSGKVLARSGLTFSLEFEDVPEDSMRRAAEGEVVIMTGGNDDRVRALVKLNNFFGTYLYVGRMVDPKVLSHVTSTREASRDYEDLQARYSSLQVTVTMIFVVVGLVLLTLAMWFGLILARQLVTPISALISTADRVRAGDMSARVPEQDTLQEFDYLAQAFNRMTKQIQEQQNELIEANRQLDRRRRFTESVLTGVSAGVLGIDVKSQINIANSSAAELLGFKDDLVGRNIMDILPALQGLLEQAHKRSGKTTQGEIPYISSSGARHIFLVRIVIEVIGDQEVGAILTLDDITELQSAQRKAAWSDVARRIAHEIKNPLTPIQLSAERLKRKYLGQIKEDPETFSLCTETIIKHVEDIGRMVSEFSSFARMPEPVMELDNLSRHIKEAIFLHKQAHRGISIDYREVPGGNFQVQFDAQQIRQALNNLIQNAVDSIAAQQGTKGLIDIVVAQYGRDEVVVAVSDNGPGLPKNASPESLTEPYVTHKVKGTGLGLAIVKKIMEDHGGRLVLGTPEWLKSIEGWKDLGGATIILVLPLEAGRTEAAA
ncbi:MAG: PAS domain-containing sensor histidine kinase [Alphaproteobacteria bacterium PRO2]|nr:PAS domain-containing sensor histidine kinase [Alphaproteobacteria bacterium PRO2]